MLVSSPRQPCEEAGIPESKGRGRGGVAVGCEVLRPGDVALSVPDDLEPARPIRGADAARGGGAVRSLRDEKTESLRGKPCGVQSLEFRRGVPPSPRGVVGVVGPGM